MKTGTNSMSVDDIRAATAEVDALYGKMAFVVPPTAAERREHSKCLAAT